MNWIKSKTTIIITLCLSFVMLFAATVPATAASANEKISEVYSTLLDAFGIPKNTFDNYKTVYANSLPIEYIKGTKTGYLALGGDTAGAYGISDFKNGYADKFAGYLGYSGNNYRNFAGGDLLASEAVEYVNSTNYDRNNIKAAIGEADIISFQIDSSSIITACQEKIMETNVKLDWSKYVTDSKFKSALDKYRAECTAEYGQSATHALECFLYESVVYCVETVKAVSEIRKLNSGATIILLGLYNPVRGLKLTAGGQTIGVDEFFDKAIEFCNVYLLSKTSGMDKVAFIDIASTSTPGFNGLTLNGDKFNMESVAKVIGNGADVKPKRFANEAGHNEIFTKLKSAINKGHNYTETVISKPTCDNPGQTKYVCKNKGCEYSYTGTKAALGHNLDDGTVNSEASCTTAGEKVYKCLRAGCQYTETKSSDPLGHDILEEIIAEASCTIEGISTFTCQREGCDYIDTDKTAPFGHQMDGGTLILEATCTTEGETKYTCLREGCGHTETETAAALDHEIGEYTSNGDATCQVAGTLSASCSRCGEIFSAADPAGPVNHDYNDSGVCVFCSHAITVKPEPTDPTVTVIVGIVTFVLGAAGGGVGGFFVSGMMAKKKATAGIETSAETTAEPTAPTEEN